MIRCKVCEIKVEKGMYGQNICSKCFFWRQRRRRVNVREETIHKQNINIISKKIVEFENRIETLENGLEKSVEIITGTLGKISDNSEVVSKIIDSLTKRVEVLEKSHDCNCSKSEKVSGEIPVEILTDKVVDNLKSKKSDNPSMIKRTYKTKEEVERVGERMVSPENSPPSEIIDMENAKPEKTSEEYNYVGKHYPDIFAECFAMASILGHQFNLSRNQSRYLEKFLVGFAKKIIKKK